MQEKKNLYGKIKTVVNHLYKSIVSENNDLKAEILKRRIDFIRSEIIKLGEELNKAEIERDSYRIDKELEEIQDEFSNEFKG